MLSHLMGSSECVNFDPLQLNSSMPFGRPENPDAHLPAIAPDLLLAQGPAGRWLVSGISKRLAALIGVDEERVRGAGLQQLGEVFPPLEELAAEALNRQEPVVGVPVRFGGTGGTTLMAELRPGGLSEDYRGQLVSVIFTQQTSEELEREVSFSGMVGSSPAIREVFRKISLYAPSDASVVITGETGTGKELVARAIHDQSPRNRASFVAVNCSAISEELLESELFGHEKGAFTGALRTHRGRFERADGGTLLLDEIGDMPLRTQAKLLRVLEEGRIERVGAEQEQQVDVRIVAATNVPLERAVGQGKFRADLYHRLSVFRIHIPALRQRLEDLPHLAGHFLKTFRRKYAKPIQRLTPEALNLLESYLWPGNIRELRNVLERVFVETEAEVIGARAFAEWVRERQDFSPGDWDLQSSDRQGAMSIAPPYPLLEKPPAQALEAQLLSSSEGPAYGHSTRPVDLDEAEIRRAYAAAGGNLTAAARLLGVHRATLYRYLDKLGISRQDLEY